MKKHFFNLLNIEFILVIGLGILFGIISGLVPGIHINLFSTLILTNLIFFTNLVEIELLVIFIISMSVVHTFVDFIPSIIFGIAQSGDDALCILPGHQLIMEGNGYKAIFLNSIGSLLGIIVSLIFGLISILILEKVYNLVNNIIPYILILTLSALLLREKDFNKKFWSFIIILFSGGYGLLVLNSKHVNEPLFLIFTSIFGIASIIDSMNNNVKIPDQKYKFEFNYNKDFYKALFVSGVASSICSIAPGIGNSQAAIISSAFLKNVSREIFLVILGSINTVNFLLSIFTFYIIERARNGSIFVISQIVSEITLNDIVKYFLLAYLVGIIAFFITVHIGKIILKNLDKISYTKINYGILVFLFIISFYTTGGFGILVLLAGTFLGLLCINLEVGRIHLMNVLTIPVIFNLI